MIKTLAELEGNSELPEWLLWVGCAGSYDERSKKITVALSKILLYAKVSFAILGEEENCTGDPAKRSGNDFLFQMVARKNIETLKKYRVKKIITFCPHCFNTIKNEYPEYGGNYKVLHYTEFLMDLIKTGKLKIGKDSANKREKVAYHDPCYLGRGNGIYDEPRELLNLLGVDLLELKRNRKNSFCCGAGGAQMFKEAEKGKKEINVERAEEARSTGAEKIAVGCPFCKLMLADGVNETGKKSEVLDISEIIARSLSL